MRLSLADLTLLDVKLSELNDNAAASGPGVEADVAGRSGIDAGEVGTCMEETLWLGPCRGPFCLRDCKAFASAFSCVRT